MADPLLSILQGTGEYSPEEMANALRGQQQQADFLSLSTLAPVSNFGRQSQQNVANQTANLGRLKQTQAAQTARETEAEKDRQNRLEIARLAAQTKESIADKKIDSDTKPSAGINKLKPTGSATQSYNKSRDLVGQIADINTELNDLTPEQAEMADSPKAEIATSILPQSVERYVQSEYVFNDPQVKQTREKLAFLESEFSKLMSGLAVTGFEMKDRQKWSPYATGISLDDRKRRVGNLNDALRRNIKTQEQTYDFGNIADVMLPSFNSKDRPEVKRVTMSEIRELGATPDEFIALGYEIVD